MFKEKFEKAGFQVLLGTTLSSSEWIIQRRVVRFTHLDLQYLLSFALLVRDALSSLSEDEDGTGWNQELTLDNYYKFNDKPLLQFIKLSWLPKYDEIILNVLKQLK